MFGYKEIERTIKDNHLPFQKNRRCRSFAFGFPFENGKAKVTNKGKMREVSGSGGEYHYWDSDEWYYIDKHGNRTK